ncbi:hypothetical protein A3H22_00320 [Candidatus Peribacteria bacterium RIFCSPLOWO2_12_FULL_55_15]|nr:MAG: hypothetical protein A2789_02425 [Candidatus Peribacteria bacterium RIFCSPHIGHO2_01_FULL_54_22]OGJ63358.1 MAG: hypothetical protein A3D12_00300 [Candidatus Peribacteria bacterium RIFCSPHIGHO2_02_FULL_55_24]OGJ64635.1 MAG: hypothetical protein A3E47_01905 [Candidatus Peribacteria bacterium RIFCSPHIGHO2_12_FULL_54_10]OGJ68229.1 MAG: hypothetical protein A2947_01920 [Candidatus Peribacteria bacterium RIFCSPLOWO2_01_FULL_54_110]OGJ69738.1 MAG: hypothetical protein A3H90_01585 [Candidatus Pe
MTKTGPTPPSEDIGSGELNPEDPPTEVGPQPGIVTEVTRTDAERTLQKPEQKESLYAKARALREMMDEALRLIDHRGFVKALDGIQKSERKKSKDKQNKDRVDIADQVRDIAAYCYHERDVVSHLENEADTIERFQNGDLPPGDFAHWMRILHEDDHAMDTMHQNLEQELQSIKEQYPDIDTKWRNTDPDDEEFGKEKEKIIKKLSLTVNAKIKLAQIQEELKKYAEYLDPVLKAVQEMRKGFEEENKAYWDEMKQIFSPIGFLKEGWENTMTILAIPAALKKIWEAYKRKWETQKERRAASMAYGAARFIPDDEFQRTLRQNLEENEEKEMKTENGEFERTGTKELITLFQERGSSFSPARIRAWLNVMSSRGALYNLKTGSHGTATCFGKNIGENIKLPVHWTPMQNEEFWRTIEVRNEQAGKKQEEEGFAFASAKGQAWDMIPHIQTHLEKYEYHFVRGIVKRAIIKGDLGHTPTWAAVKLIRALQPGQHPYLTEPVLKSFGGLIFDPQCSAPQSHLLSTLKFMSTEYIRRAREGTMGAEHVIEKAFRKAEQLIRAGGGLRIDEQDKNKDGKDVVGPSAEDRLDYAIAKLFGTNTVHTQTGGAITIYDPTIEEFVKYRESIEEAYEEKYSATVDLTKIDSDYGNTISELFLVPPAHFVNLLRPDTNGKLPTAAVVNGLLRQLHESYTRLPQTARATFIGEMRKRWTEPIIAQILTHTKVQALLGTELKNFHYLIDLNIITTGDIRDRIGERDNQVKEQNLRAIGMSL